MRKDLSLVLLTIATTLGAILMWTCVVWVLERL